MTIDLSRPIVAEDEDGSCWTEINTTHCDEQRQGVCSICDRPIGMGWLCLDVGNQVCASHITVSKTGVLSVTNQPRLELHG